MQLEDFELNKLKNRISIIMRKIRENTPRVPVSPDKAKSSELWNGFANGVQINRVIIYLRSSGCFWSIKKQANNQIRFLPGCLDCAHSIAETTFGRQINAENYVKQFRTEIEKFDAQDYNTICVYNEGNFFNPEELPKAARLSILSDINLRKNIKTLVFESLPEFITDSILEEIRCICGDREVEIAIGLESINPIVRKLCINKNYDLPAYEACVKLIHKHGMKVLSYVMLKPAFTTEKEAREDALTTTDYAFNLGSDVVSIEPVNLSKYNMSGKLAELGLHRAPWLWTVRSVLDYAHRLGEVRFGGDQFAPMYHQQAFNCSKCTAQVKESLSRYNGDNNINSVNSLKCDCLTEWQNTLDQESEPIVARLPAILDQLESNLKLKN
jgi:radical SAM enzyme (TIGR01210 family)